MPSPPSASSSFRRSKADSAFCAPAVHDIVNLQMNRRHLLQFATAAMFQSHAIDRVRAATSAAATRTPEEIATDEDFWSEIRAAFSVDRNVIKLNNGYVSPSPRSVQDAMRRGADVAV